MSAYILHFVLAISSGTTTPMTTLSGEYSSHGRCLDAIKVLREKLSHGSVILATCTPK